MTFRASTMRWVALLLMAAAQNSHAQSPTLITLTPTTSPGAGEPGVTNISVTGSNFPTGTIPPANVTVSLTPAAGGAAVTTPASAVATVAGAFRSLSRLPCGFPRQPPIR